MRNAASPLAPIVPVGIDGDRRRGVHIPRPTGSVLFPGWGPKIS